MLVKGRFYALSVTVIVSRPTEIKEKRGHVTAHAVRAERAAP